jgi:hypothetical protein
VNPNFPYNRKNNNHITINVFHPKPSVKSDEIPSSVSVSEVKRFSLSWLWLLIKRLWQHPKKLITAALSALLLWLASFLNIKLPSLPLPLPSKVELKQVENKPSEQQSTNKPSEVSKTNTVNVTNTNTVNVTNTITKTNYVTETKYVTNFILQPIVVTNTVFKEVPITVTNVIVIKNASTNSDNNSIKSQNGPAYFISDDFNTILQNQQQNPVRGRTVN